MTASVFLQPRDNAIDLYKNKQLCSSEDSFH